MVRRASSRRSGIALLVAIPLLAGCPKHYESNTDKLSRLYDQYNCHPGAQRDTDTGAIIVKNKTYSHATLSQVRDHQYYVQNWCKR